MQVGCYSLDLYCDNEGAHPHNYRNGNNLEDGQFPSQYTAETASSCRRQARKVGWKLGKKDLCPRCAKNLK